MLLKALKTTTFPKNAHFALTNILFRKTKTAGLLGKTCEASFRLLSLTISSIESVNFVNFVRNAEVSISLCKRVSLFWKRPRLVKNYVIVLSIILFDVIVYYINSKK